jgi:Schlafen, AlbA_2
MLCAMTNRPLSNLVDLLRATPRVWVRIAAAKPEADWRLALFEVTLGDPPPRWRREQWVYPRAAFIAASPAGTTVATWLERRRLSVRRLTLDVGVAEPLSVQRHESRFPTTFETLPWPTREWTLQHGASYGNAVQDELVAPDAPAFLSYDQAAVAFFGIPPRPNRSFASYEAVVREQDQRARIDAVHIRPTEIVVAISGQALNGAYITLGGVGAPRKQVRRATRQVRLPLASPLGSGAWVALHRKDELLDRRILDPAWRQPEVTVEVDAATEVELLISRGEDVFTEFKQELPGANPRAVMKTVAAFANGEGGALIFGVDDDGRITGIAGDTERNIIDRMTQLITDWVRPHVNFTANVVDVEGSRVLVLEVPSGPDAPYGVGTGKHDFAYYVRRQASTFPATPEDVRAAVQARQSTDPGLRFPRRRR